MDKLRALHKQIKLIDADVWILTETNACVSPGSEYKFEQSTPITEPERYWPGENRTTIWSRFPIKRTIGTYDPETAVCAEIEHAGMPFLVYGTIIPYHAAATQYPYRFNGEILAGRKAWELHTESIELHAMEWKRLRAEFPSHILCIAGDLNQSRSERHWYGTRKGRELLTNALSDANLTCLTEGEIVTGEGNILPPAVDHICLDRTLATQELRVGGWQPGKSEIGRSISDHTGVYVDVLPLQKTEPAK